MLKRRGIGLVEMLVVMLIIAAFTFFMIKTCNRLESKMEAQTIVKNLTVLKYAVLTQPVQTDQKYVSPLTYTDYPLTNNDHMKYFVCFEKEESHSGIYVVCSLEESCNNTELKCYLADMAEEHGLLNEKGNPYKQESEGSRQVRIFVKAL